MTMLWVRHVVEADLPYREGCRMDGSIDWRTIINQAALAVLLTLRTPG